MARQDLLNRVITLKDLNTSTIVVQDPYVFELEAGQLLIDDVEITSEGSEAMEILGENGTDLITDLDTLYVHKGAYNAEGDLLVGGANDTYTTLPVGSTNAFLLADSAVVGGVKWVSTLPNLLVGVPGTLFSETATTAGVYLGFGTGNTPRVMFATGTVGQNWQIDNAANVLRFYKPGAVYMSLGTSGLDVAGVIQATTTITSNGPTAGVGYRTGAGGTVTQTGSITTTVVVNKVCGSIVTVTAPAIAAGAEAEFTVTNSTVVATDVVNVCMKAQFTDGVVIPYVKSVAAGSFVLGLTNVGSAAVSAGAATINFAVVRAVTS